MDFNVSPLSTFDVIAITTTLIAGAVIWSILLSGPKAFNYPIYGVEDEKPTDLMRRFQHQADVLLIDAYKKVITNTRITSRIGLCSLSDIVQNVNLFLNCPTNTELY